MTRRASLVWSAGAAVLAGVGFLWWRWGEPVFVSALATMLC